MTGIVREWLEQGEAEKLEQKKRRDAKARQKIVSRIFADLPHIAHPGGYFLWIPLPENVRCDAVISRLRAANIAVSPAESYAVTRDIPQAIRVAVSTLPYDDLESALMTVRDTIFYLMDL
ncbi:aminotransferase class I/II-fold pyridoxal phosphate-dependent enzyme [Morganella morganii]|uniref:aminotransferase class I/II-fold pyridoxal phosphate-dependent enzyme n=1 Tax=Morganella morganii TaxID=582 RepID=UPI001F3E058E|nr:aminotransferase class I/II-fold pyridoxal phosphate-dependent enzyme [Morganella morganii]